MIKVVKHGQKEFNCTCPRCGCEFTYEYEDIHTETIKGITYSYSSTSYVVCPDCRYHCEVPGKTNWPPFINDPIPTDQFNTPSGTSACHECDWWKKITQPGGFTYVGDTPCTWCNKGPYKILCGVDSSISSSSNIKAKLEPDHTIFNNLQEYTHINGKVTDSNKIELKENSNE